MRLPYSFFWLLLLFIFSITLNTSGQITTIGAKKVAYIGSIKDFAYFYPQVSGSDSVVFNAVSTTEGSKATFLWSKLTNAFTDSIIQKNDSVFNSEVKVSVPNGYKLRITDAAGLDTTFNFWCFKNNISFKLKKDKDGYVPQLNSFCDYVDLEYDSVKITEFFLYYNTEKSKWDTLKNAVKDTATVSPASDISVNQKETIKNLVRVMNPPIEESEFTCIVKDLYGAETSDKVKYKPIRVEAKMDTTLILNKSLEDVVNNKEVNQLVFEDGESGYKSYAPVTIEFGNETKNAETFVWYMGDGDTIETVSLTEKFQHTYYLSDGTASKEYKIWLVASNDFGCIDSISETVKVTEPKITVPNVFTPDGVGGNEYFVIKTASVRYFKITIYSKSGKIVYKDEGPDIYRFKWDGKIMHSSTDAKPGIYYYTLIYQIWDKTSSIDKNKVSHGFIYLYRQ